MLNLQEYNSIDETLAQIAKHIKPLYYVNPSKENEVEQKELFLSGKTKNPSFKYKEVEYDPKEIEQKLNSVETSDDAIGKLFAVKKRNALLEHKLIMNRGNKDVVQEATITINGFPSEVLVDYAAGLLKEIPNMEVEKKVPSDKIKKAMEKALHDNGLTDWVVEYSDKRMTTVYSAEKKVTVCEHRYFAEIDPERLGVHEIGVHALRAANGYEQPLKIFALGLPEYLPTEEGLASYSEEITGNTSDEIIRDYAARVIAVDSVCQELDFRQTFDRLKSYDLSDDQAWKLSLRAHRGGGYVKDHVYLDGLLKVREFVQEDGDFKTLYTGKFGIDDLPLVRDLLEQGILKKAKHIPYFLK
nr:DUF1704 domain-containing protein [Nanoarchaeota archaeon]